MRAVAPTLCRAKRGPHLPASTPPPLRGRPLTDVSTKVDTYQQPSEPVRGEAVWAGRTVGAMDGAIEPPGVRALCLRRTASQARERPTASGWAGPRSGVYGVSCQPTPPHQTSRKPEPLWPWLWLSLFPASGRHYPQVQGAVLPAPPPLRTKTISLFSANRHPFATPVPYCGAACAQGRPMLKIARPSLRSIQERHRDGRELGEQQQDVPGHTRGALPPTWRHP